MGMIERQAVSSTNASGVNPAGMSPVSGNAPPSSGFYTATVVSYDSTSMQVGLAVSWLAGYGSNANLMASNFSTVPLRAGQTVVVLGSGTSGDVVIGVV